MSKQYTENDKIRMYAKGEYVFHAPPVSTAAWNMDDWIKFIDKGNGWTPTNLTILDEQEKNDDETRL